MNPEGLHTSLIETLSLTLVITSVAAVEMRRLKFSIVAYLVLRHFPYTLWRWKSNEFG